MEYFGTANEPSADTGFDRNDRKWGPLSSNLLEGSFHQPGEERSVTNRFRKRVAGSISRRGGGSGYTDGSHAGQTSILDQTRRAGWRCGFAGDNCPLDR